MRMGSEGSRLAREWASWRREPQIPGGLVSLSSLVFCGLGREEISYGCTLCSRRDSGSYISDIWRQRGGLSRFCRW